MDSKEVNYDFARAWDLNQGSFAHGMAENLLNYAERNNRKADSVYDICCGASNLLEYYHSKGLKCFGTETRQGMFEYSKDKLPEVTYFQTNNIFDMPGKEKVDFVTCTHDLVNYLEKFDEWTTLFKNVIKHLNKDGIFLFDFYTQYKLANWNETTFSSSNHLDCLTTVKSGIYDKTLITYTYYVHYTDYSIKTKDVVVECYFDTDKIVEALHKVGFKNVQLVDSNLNPLESTNYVERIHVLASRK